MGNPWHDMVVCPGLCFPNNHGNPNIFPETSKVDATSLTPFAVRLPAIRSALEKEPTSKTALGKGRTQRNQHGRPQKSKPKNQDILLPSAFRRHTMPGHTMAISVPLGTEMRMLPPRKPQRRSWSVKITSCRGGVKAGGQRRRMDEGVDPPLEWTTQVSQAVRNTGPTLSALKY